MALCDCWNVNWNGISAKCNKCGREINGGVR